MKIQLLLLMFYLYCKVDGKRLTCTSTYCEKLPDNMPSALRGYNILTGDPHQQSHDPGFKNLIFDHVRTVNGKTVLQPGITTSELYNCQKKLYSKSFATIEEYRKYVTDETKVGKDLQIGVEKEITVKAKIEVVDITAKYTIPPPFTRAWSSSSAFSKLESYFTSKQGLLSVTLAKCYIYEMELNHFLLPPFTIGFKRALYLLYQYRNFKQIQPYVFRDFIQAFGTHYVAEAIMGAQFESRTRYEEEIREKFDAQTLQECNTKKGAKIFGISIEKSTSSCTNSVEESLSKNYQSAVFHETLTKGSKSLNFQDWSKENFKPVPLKFKLAPIVHLIKKLYVDDVNLEYNGNVIKSDDILKWFVPLYFDYCKNMLVGSCTTTNTGVSKCGVNDQCPIDSVCVGNKLCKDRFKCNWRYTPWQDRQETKVYTHTTTSGWWIKKKKTDHYDTYGSVYSLTSHHLKCGNNEAINAFRLEGRNGGTQFRYVYKCCSTGLPCQEGSYRKVNAFTYVERGFMIFLDRQHVTCDNNFISNFRLDGGNQIRYIYDCCFMNYKLAQYTKSCIDKTTPYEEDGGHHKGNAWHLDRIPVDCGEGRYLTYFRLNRNSAFTKWRYSYRCCKYQKK